MNKRREHKHALLFGDTLLACHSVALASPNAARSCVSLSAHVHLRPLCRDSRAALVLRLAVDAGPVLAGLNPTAPVPAAQRVALEYLSSASPPCFSSISWSCSHLTGLARTNCCLAVFRRAAGTMDLPCIQTQLYVCIRAAHFTPTLGFFSGCAPLSSTLMTATTYLSTPCPRASPYTAYSHAPPPYNQYPPYNSYDTTSRLLRSCGNTTANVSPWSNTRSPTLNRQASPPYPIPASSPVPRQRTTSPQSFSAFREHQRSSPQRAC